MSSCTGLSTCACGCCAGTAVLTPAGISNAPGLPAVAYRTGTWATFKESMLARLSSFDYPALAGLKTRDDDDFTIALLDAAAVMLDILTFYQERLANESYLRTAVQLRSLVELSRLINYQPAPGVSASVYLAFTLKGTPGLPADPAAPAITIPAGTQVQSVPAQGQAPQTFETAAGILAKPEWSAMGVQTSTAWVPGGASVYLQGTATQLQPGDAVLILSGGSGTVRTVTAVSADSAYNRTQVTWSAALTGPLDLQGSDPPQPAVHALRQRASLFGYNAINPLMLTSDTVAQLSGQIDSTTHDWVFNRFELQMNRMVDLDAVYAKVAPGGWLVLIDPQSPQAGSPAGRAVLYQIEAAATVSRSDFALSSRISRLTLNADTSLTVFYFDTRFTVALTQSELLPVAEQPLSFPLYASAIDLDALRPDLSPVQGVAVSGKAQKVALLGPCAFTPDDAPDQAVTLGAGDVLTLLDASGLPLPDANGDIQPWDTSATSATLRVASASGRAGTVTVTLSQLALAASSSSDPIVQEHVPVSSLQITGTPPAERTRLLLGASLKNAYDRSTVAVNANVGLATAGRSTTEILGNGSASTPNQTFTLKQAPLTFIQAPTPTGRQSTLQVSVSGVQWSEAPTLYQQAATARVFSTLNQPGGATTVLFGDGIEGSRLPTDQNNVQATYRVGLGAAGNVAAGSITTLMDRPLGVSGVNNPESATGGQDADSVEDIRAHAPLSVLTLGRAVSIADYQSFAATFAGIAKAYAIWVPSGPGRGVFLTVAAAGGVALPQGNPTLSNLVTALHDFGNPLIPITVTSFTETLFSVSADLLYDPAYDRAAVKSAVIQALTQAYGFAARAFGQGVSVDEIEALIQGVPGVLAVNVTALTAERAGPESADRLCAYVPIANPLQAPQPAEILVLDPGPAGLTLGDLS